jgi:sodium/potassium-transporting ATPase subunit alpha
LQAILAADLVPGDIVQLDEGAVVPADLRLFQVSPDLKFNKSVLTGDSNLFKSSVDRTSLDFLDVFFLMNYG